MQCNMECKFSITCETYFVLQFSVRHYPYSNFFPYIMQSQSKSLKLRRRGEGLAGISWQVGATGKNILWAVSENFTIKGNHPLPNVQPLMQASILALQRFTLMRFSNLLMAISCSSVSLCSCRTRGCNTYHMEACGHHVSVNTMSCAALHGHSKHPPWPENGSPHCYSQWLSLRETPTKQLLPRTDHTTMHGLGEQIPPCKPIRQGGLQNRHQYS